LAHVDAIGVHGEGEIHTVVDDEEAACLAASAPELPGERVDVDGWKLLLAELDETAAATEHGVQERGQLAPAGRAAIEDDVERGG